MIPPKTPGMIRSWLDATSEARASAVDRLDGAHVMPGPRTRLSKRLACRSGRIVALPSGELVFYGLGTGDSNELAREFAVLARLALPRDGLRPASRPPDATAAAAATLPRPQLPRCCGR